MGTERRFQNPCDGDKQCAKLVQSIECQRINKTSRHHLSASASIYPYCVHIIFMYADRRKKEKDKKEKSFVAKS